MTRSATLCVLPWVQAATSSEGKLRLCCVSAGNSDSHLGNQTLAEYWNSEYLKDIRRKMLAGLPVAACRQCHREEAQGLVSHRLVTTRKWQRRLGEAVLEQLLDGTAEDGSVKSDVQSLDLRLGNQCNMQCIMCNSEESSRWTSAAKRMHTVARDRELATELATQAAVPAGRFTWYRDPAFWAGLRDALPKLREITIAGGEPFLVKEQFAFIEHCCVSGHAGHIRLRYHTNGTTFPERLKPYVARFEGVHFMVSVDGVGRVADYIRYPTNWPAIEHTVKRLDRLGGRSAVTVTATCHALNVARIPEVYEWVDGLSLQSRQYLPRLEDLVTINPVHEPSYLSIRVLPADVKESVAERLTSFHQNRLGGSRDGQLPVLVDFMKSADHSLQLPRLADYVRTLDVVRGTNAPETFPELASLFARLGVPF